MTGVKLRFRFLVIAPRVCVGRLSCYNAVRTGFVDNGYRLDIED